MRMREGQKVRRNKNLAAGPRAGWRGLGCRLDGVSSLRVARMGFASCHLGRNSANCIQEQH